jgi:hypothetical protein
MTAIVARVLRKLDWMREQRIWPDGMRYLWTDAFGVVLFVSLYRELRRNEFLDEAERVVRKSNAFSDGRAVFELAKPRIVMASTFTISRCGSSRYHDWARYFRSIGQKQSD